MTPILEWPRRLSRRGRVAWILSGLLIVSGQISAHHGTRVSYDWTNPARITGTVTEFVWRNPHVRLFFDVMDEEGNVVNWGGEMSSPMVLVRAGWTRTTLESGDEVGYRHQSGREPPTFCGGNRRLVAAFPPVVREGLACENAAPNSRHAPLAWRAAEGLSVPAERPVCPAAKDGA